MYLGCQRSVLGMLSCPQAARGILRHLRAVLPAAERLHSCEAVSGQCMSLLIVLLDLVANVVAYDASHGSQSIQTVTVNVSMASSCAQQPTESYSTYTGCVLSLMDARHNIGTVSRCPAS